MLIDDAHVRLPVAKGRVIDHALAPETTAVATRQIRRHAAFSRAFLDEPAIDVMDNLLRYISRAELTWTRLAPYPQQRLGATLPSPDTL